MTCSIEIGEVAANEVASTLDFIMQARAQVFPMLADSPMPVDLAGFPETYSAERGGLFLVARQAGQVVAGIGYLAYDHRFAQLDYRSCQVVEVVRLFVDPAFRRAGLASQLYAALRARALGVGVEVLYLHTHPFLPGAIAFWQRQGFRIVDVESDPVWRTTHMECVLAGAC